MPFITAGFCDRDFILADVKRCAFPAVGRLHFDQSLTAIGFEAGNVEAIAIAVLHGGPAHFIGKIVSSSLQERLALVMQDQLFTSLTEPPVPGIAFSHIIFLADCCVATTTMAG